MNTAFFNSLIDDFGIWEHSDGLEPVRREGYALDDAARGLILCLLLKDEVRAEVLFDYVAKSFQDGKLYGFAFINRRFWGAPASEDATGQVVWAMGLAQHMGYRTVEASKLMAQAKQLLHAPKYVRGPAYALLGAIYSDPHWAVELAADIKRRFEDTKSLWPWPEPFLTYANGIIPYALLRYAKQTGDATAAQMGLSALEFVDRTCRINGKPTPIGNQGWFSVESEEPPMFSQQPIDAAYMVWAALAAYKFTGEAKWVKCAEQWVGWFDGANVTGEKLYDPVTNRCFDGIDAPTRVSTNSGAESNICWLLTQWAMEYKRLF